VKLLHQLEDGRMVCQPAVYRSAQVLDVWVANDLGILWGVKFIDVWLKSIEDGFGHQFLLMAILFAVEECGRERIIFFRRCRISSACSRKCHRFNLSIFQVDQGFWT
jgi:hypothetical protein